MTTQKTQTKSTKYRLAEASFLFVLILAVAVGIGMKMSSGDAEGTTVVAESTPAAVVAEESSTELAAQVLAAAETEAVIAEVASFAEPSKPVYDEATPASQIYRDGEDAYFEREFDTAADIFALYTERRPANAWGHYMHGLALWKADRLDESEIALNRAIELKPQHIKSLVNLGRVHLAQGRAEDALIPVENALIIDPGYADGYRVLGRVYHNLGRRDEAVVAYMSALSCRTDDAWALNNLGLVYLEMDRPDEALAPLACAVDLDADQAVFQNNLGIALERSGHVAQAAEAYARAVELNNYPKAVTSLARVDAWLDATGDRETPQADLVALAENFSSTLQVAVESIDDMSVTEQAPVPVASVTDSTAVSPSAATTVAVTGDGF